MRAGDHAGGLAPGSPHAVSDRPHGDLQGARDRAAQPARADRYHHTGHVPEPSLRRRSPTAVHHALLPSRESESESGSPASLSERASEPLCASLFVNAVTVPPAAVSSGMSAAAGLFGRALGTTCATTSLAGLRSTVHQVNRPQRPDPWTCRGSSGIGEACGPYYVRAGSRRRSPSTPGSPSWLRLSWMEC